VNREIDCLLTDWSEWIFTHHGYPKKTLNNIPKGGYGAVIPDCEMPEAVCLVDNAMLDLKAHRAEHLAIKIRYLPQGSGLCRTQQEQYEIWREETGKGRRAYHSALYGAGMWLEGRLLRGTRSWRR